MIDRYIYAVTRELPKNQREEISREIRGLIEDMMEQGEASLSREEKVTRALEELGDPKVFAHRYLAKERYLIGPSYFDKYLLVLKIVALSIFIGISIAWGLASIFSIESLVKALSNYLSSLFSALLYGAAWVTGIFALLEYYEVSLDKENRQKEWEPSQLPLLPEKKATISRGESIFSIIFMTIFLSVFFFAPEKIGIYYKVGAEWDFIRLFTSQGLASFRIIIFIVFALNILIELIKIIKGRWTLKIAIATSILGFLSSALFIFFIHRDIWEKDMVEKFEKYLPLSFEKVLYLVSLVILIVVMAESLSALYKAIRYGRR